MLKMSRDDHWRRLPRNIKGAMLHLHPVDTLGFRSPTHAETPPVAHALAKDLGVAFPDIAHSMVC